MNAPTASLFRSDYKNIDFSTNWNNKLNCKCFTTFRLWKNQFRVGQLAIVRLSDTEIKLVKIEVVTPIRLYEVTETLSLTDAGLTLDKFKALIHRMYKGKVLSVDDASYVLITLVTVETYAVAPFKH